MFIAFVAPKVYEMNKDQIDDGLAKAKMHGQKGYDMAKGEINKTVEKVPQLKAMRDRMTNAPKKTE